MNTLAPRSAAKAKGTSSASRPLPAVGIRVGGSTDAFGKTISASAGKSKESQMTGGETNISQIGA